MKEELAEKLKKSKEARAKKSGKLLSKQRHNYEIRDFSQLAYFTL